MSARVTRNRTRRGDLLNTTSTPLAVPPGAGTSSSSGGVRPNSSGCPLSGAPDSRSKAAAITAALQPHAPCTGPSRFRELPSLSAHSSVPIVPRGQLGSRLEPKVIHNDRVCSRIIQVIHALLVIHRDSAAGRLHLVSRKQTGVRGCDVGEGSHIPAIVLEDVHHRGEAVHCLPGGIAGGIRADLQVPRLV